MTTEYVLGPDDTHKSLAQDLLSQAAHPDQVHWSPRPDVPGGGVYVLADEGIAQRVREMRAARRAEEEQRIQVAQAAAEERDSHEDVASGLLTPAEAGFPANAGTDPGSAGEAEANAQAVADGNTATAPDDAAVADDETADEPVADDPSTPEDESKMTPAQRRAAKRKANQEAAAQAATEEKSE
jgi:hypothetical protein